jgi:hypothetical protein
MDNFLSFQKLPRGAGRHSLSSVLASGLAVVYLLTNAVGVYATEGTLWNDRRTAIQNRRSDGLVLAKASLPIPGMESPLFPPLSSLSHASVGEGMTQKSLAWLPRLVLPYGEIREVHLARPGAPLVLHIQDAHDVEEAQRNMGGLVTSLLKEGQVQLIGLEGASGPVPMDLFRQLPDHDVTRGVLDLALRLGYMGGAELAAFDAPQSTLWGVESPDLYAGNLTAFEKGESFKVQDQLWIDRLSLAGDAAVSQWYGKALSEFEIHRAGYEKGSEGLAEWLTYLWKNRPQNRPYAHLSRLKSVLEKESSLDFKAVEKERQSMAEVLARVLPAGDLQRLVDQSLSLRMGRVSFTDYHRFLESLCVRHGVRMGAYPHLKEYIAYVAAAEDIDRSGLIEELADLEVVVENRLAVTPEEQKVAGSRRSLGTLRKLVNHQLTPIEWHAYEKNRPDAALVAQTLAKWGGKSVPETDLQGLTAYENYAIFALKRNRALAGNLLDKMRQEKAKVAVLVAGGFHTEGLTQILRESGASYVVVGPRISKVPDNVHALEAIVRAPLPIETLLAGNVIHLATPRLSAAIPASLGQASLTRDWIQRGRATLGKFLFGYQGIHALQKRGAALDHSVFDSLRQGGYVSGEMTQSPLVLPGDTPGKLTALRVTEGEKRGHVLVAALKSDVNSDPNVFLNAGLSAPPVHEDSSTDLVIHYYRESDIVQPGILVRWSRQGAGSIVQGAKRVAAMDPWGGLADRGRIWSGVGKLFGLPVGPDFASRFDPALCGPRGRGA